VKEACEICDIVANERVSVYLDDDVFLYVESPESAYPLIIFKEHGVVPTNEQSTYAIVRAQAIWKNCIVKNDKQLSGNHWHRLIEIRQ
jgi:hypothetical protein